MSKLPPVLDNLLAAENASSMDAWAEFTREYSALLLHVARSTSHGRDDAMDAYAYVLDHLRANDYRRLRGYAVTPTSKFTTWLVVVARRICIDHNRVRYGRIRNAHSDAERERLRNRRRLEDLSNILHESDDILDENEVWPDREVEAAEVKVELNAALAAIHPTDRLLIKLRFEDGLSAAEIAQIMRYPSQFHVYRRLNAILATLKSSLRARGIETAAS
jgi:RNA polymerase sigma factor (sigma-70 family)